MEPGTGAGDFMTAETVHICAHGKDWRTCEPCRAEYFGNRSSKTDLADEDAANIGRALMDTLHSAYPAYSWLNCPSEIVTDLLNDRDEARNEVERLQSLVRVKDKDYQTLRAAYEGRAVEAGPGNPTQMLIDSHTKPLHVEIERLRHGAADRPYYLDGLTIEQWREHAKKGWEQARRAPETAALRIVAEIKRRMQGVKLGETLPAGQFPKGVSKYNALHWAADLIEEIAGSDEKTAACPDCGSSGKHARFCPQVTGMPLAGLMQPVVPRKGES